MDIVLTTNAVLPSDLRPGCDSHVAVREGALGLACEIKPSRIWAHEHAQLRSRSITIVGLAGWTVPRQVATPTFHSSRAIEPSHVTVRLVRPTKPMRQRNRPC